MSMIHGQRMRGWERKFLYAIGELGRRPDATVLTYRGQDPTSAKAALSRTLNGQGNLSVRRTQPR